jgi:hypothetical protein
MRRLSIAALSAAVILSACSERRQTPTEPGTALASAKKSAEGSCLSPFPLGFTTLPDGADLQVLVGQMFAGSPNLNAANAKLRSIASQCDKGKVGNARHEASTFVDWMVKKYGQGGLADAGALALGGLIADVFIAVGGQFGGIDPGVFGPRGGVGVFTPGEDFHLTNQNGTAAIHIPSDGFSELTLITIIPLPDSPGQLNTGEGGPDQFPPFYDINAANASGNHVLEEGSEADIGFCPSHAVLDQIAEQDGDPQIGHNPVFGAPNYPFEILNEISTIEYADLVAFGLTCATPVNAFEGSTLRNGGGLGDIALFAWHRYARPLAESIFLPTPLHAATLGHLGLGGAGRSISPFGVVDASSGGG